MAYFPGTGGALVVAPGEPHPGYHYAQGLGKPHVHQEWIGYGVKGTKQTVERMRDAALGQLKNPKTGRLLPHEGSHHPEVRFLAQKIVSKVPSKDYVGEVRAIDSFMREAVRYTLDPRNLEWVQTPWWTLLVMGQGDCDDHATAICALAHSLGHGCGVRTVKGDSSRPDQYSHVYAIVGIKQNGRELWIPVDTTEASARFGKDPAGAERVKQRDWIFSPAG